MSRRRKAQPRKASLGAPLISPVRPPRRRQASAEAIFTTGIVGAIAYVGVEMALGGKPHPTHWLVTAVFALIAYGGAETIYRHRNPF